MVIILVQLGNTLVNVLQLGEAGFNDALRVRLFSLSLTGTAFSWFSLLAPNSIRNWAQLEHKFHDHFFSGETKQNCWT